MPIAEHPFRTAPGCAVDAVWAWCRGFPFLPMKNLPPRLAEPGTVRNRCRSASCFRVLHIRPGAFMKPLTPYAIDQPEESCLAHPTRCIRESADQAVRYVHRQR